MLCFMTRLVTSKPWAIISRFGTLSFVLGIVMALCYVVGFVQLSVIDCLLEVAWVRLLSLGHAQSLLAQCSVRTNARDWEKWCAARPWELAGFGLPCWACFRLHPLLGLAMLELMHGNAACFWHGQQEHHPDWVKSV